MSEHTVGPWEVEGENGEIFADFNGKRAVVARAYAWDGDGKHTAHHDALRSGRAFVRFANAHLIAAAPDLLESLKGCFGALEALIAEEPVLAARIAGSTTVGNHRAAANAAIAKATGNVREEMWRSLSNE